MASYPSRVSIPRSHQAPSGDCNSRNSSPSQPILAPPKPVQEECDPFPHEPVFSASFTSSTLLCSCEIQLPSEKDQDDGILPAEVAAILPDNSMDPIQQVCHSEGLEENDLQILESEVEMHSVPTGIFTNIPTCGSSLPSWDCASTIATQPQNYCVEANFAVHPCVSKAGTTEKMASIQLTAKVNRKVLPMLKENAKRCWIGYQITCLDEHNRRLNCTNSHTYSIVEMVNFFEDFLPCTKIKSYSCQFLKLTFKLYFIIHLKKMFKFTEYEDEDTKDEDSKFLWVDMIHPRKKK